MTITSTPPPAPQEPPSRPTLLTPEEVAQYLRISQKTLANWRCADRGPRYLRIGRDIRYPENALVDWLEQGVPMVPSGESDARTRA